MLVPASILFFLFLRKTCKKLNHSESSSGRKKSDGHSGSRENMPRFVATTFGSAHEYILLGPKERESVFSKAEYNVC